MRAGISTEILDPEELKRLVLESPPMIGSDLALAVSPTSRSVFPAARERFHVAAIDYGMKRNIVRLLNAAGCRVTVFPATASAEAILAAGPDGIFLSNGPGDPAALGAQIRTIEKPHRKETDFRDLPGAPASRARARGQDIQAEVRTSRGEPSRGGSADHLGRDHVAEPRLRRGWRHASGGGRADSPELERRHARGLPPPRAPHPGRPVPSGGLSRAPRRQRALRQLHRSHGNRTGSGNGKRETGNERMRSSPLSRSFSVSRSGSTAPDASLPRGGPRLSAVTPFPARLVRVAPLYRGDRSRGRRARGGDGPALGLPLGNPGQTDRRQRGGRGVSAVAGLGRLSRHPFAAGTRPARPAGQGCRGSHLPVGHGVLRGDARRDGRDPEGGGPGVGAGGLADRRVLARRAAGAHARLVRRASGRRDRRRAGSASGRPRGRQDRALRARPRRGHGPVRASNRPLSGRPRLQDELRRVRRGMGLPRPRGPANTSAGWTPRPTSSRSSSTRSGTPRAPRGRSRRRPGRASRSPTGGG